MTLSFEVLLVLGVLGFYVFDSAMLFFSNEFAYIQSKGKWLFAYPGSCCQILGRNLYIPNPLTPARPLFRLCWFDSVTNEQQEDYEALQQFVDALKPLRYFTMVLFALLIVGLPVMIYMNGSDWALIFLFSLIYITVGGMLIQIYLQRKELSLPTKTFVKFAFDSLLCVPFSLNVLRKITMHRIFVGDPIKLAQKLFDETDFIQLVNVICNRIDEELEYEEKESARYEMLNHYKMQIMGMIA